jgi:DHA1 family inner membrane transport protein
MSLAPPAPPADPPAHRLTRREWGLLLLLAAINCTEVTDALLLSPLAKRLQSSDGGLGLSNSEYLYSAGVYGFAAAVCGLLAAAFVDRFCRKRVVVVSLLGLLGAIAASGLAWNFASFFAARLVAGAFGGVTVCGTLAILADQIPEQRRGAALSILNGSFAVAAVITLPVCAVLAVVTAHFAPPFFLVVGGGAVVWVFTARKLPRMTDHCRAERANPLAEMVRVVGRPNHLRAFALMLCSALGAYTVIPLMALYMEQNVGVPAAHIPFVFLAMGACSLPAVVLAGRLSDRVGLRPVFFVAVGLFVVVTLVVTNLPPVESWVAWVVACAYMAIAVGRLVPTNGIMLSAAHPPDRGAYTTVYNSVSLLGTSFGPFVASLIVPNTPETEPVQNYPVCGLVACGFALAAAGLSFVVRPAPQPAGAT